MKNPDPSSLFLTASKLFEAGEPAIIIEVVEAAGSTPREAGTKMLVTGSRLHGTIGGGQLEWIAMEQAHAMLSGNHGHEDDATHSTDISLGPEIGQCCGGKVTLMFSLLNADTLKTLKDDGADTPLGSVQIHGAGHTGKALAKTLSNLPMNLQIIDTRKEALEAYSSDISVHTPMPESIVRQASPQTAFVVLTHEHNLDFMIAAEALQRGDAAYVGMIGSKTKRAVFGKWLGKNGYEQSLENNLICPIGGSSVKDKRPAVIAAMVTAELLQVFATIQTRG